MPANNNINITELQSKMDDLLNAFGAHPGMQPPSVSPTVFFIADFVRNTRASLAQIDKAKYQAGDARARQQLNEVMGRNGFANMLISDTTGQLSAMTGGGGPVDFGDDIRTKIQAVVA
ncbi:hypothetical protein ATEIFO6365_0010028900 [Aspergillus terreus]|uniref:Uncharacterized protein n=1 Tax=Aspergillus terreus TaxID=33178 RepID=A0A5M3Z9K3_ASPTE|nr:hypothetical protein ATETN484_0012026800 [Aspergillus terreus]GFF19516.1 hypothetical protein ATEIFO6365_0010028900 [Aspergillus terreus]